MSLPITAFYASLLGLSYLYLSLAVIAIRRKAQIGIGDGGNHDLMRISRVHANFNEYVPITLIMLACLESISHWNAVMHIGASALLFGRILHAYGLRHHDGASWQRFIGMIMTFISMLLLAGTNLFELHFLVV
ncbi:MAPEG family protein [Alteromonas ponticola]|uniref:Glutathione S-transferase n=1 Tax=Alteromonas ponticola TaxID=2720613 RepID=A0ABX1R7Y5_9ALTE|nr:MAPEG family protein [Alteromonas ponticola]NMH61360.1 glutathione S-transferase [Alteromonas ponticola]